MTVQIALDHKFINLSLYIYIPSSPAHTNQPTNLPYVPRNQIGFPAHTFPRKFIQESKHNHAQESPYQSFTKESQSQSTQSMPLSLFHLRCCLSNPFHA